MGGGLGLRHLGLITEASGSLIAGGAQLGFQSGADVDRRVSDRGGGTVGTLLPFLPFAGLEFLARALLEPALRAVLAKFAVLAEFPAFTVLLPGFLARLADFLCLALGGRLTTLELALGLVL